MPNHPKLQIIHRSLSRGANKWWHTHTGCIIHRQKGQATDAMQLISNSPHQVRKSDSTGSMTKVIYLGMSFMCHSATGVPSPKDGGKERWGGGCWWTVLYLVCGSGGETAPWFCQNTRNCLLKWRNFTVCQLKKDQKENTSRASITATEEWAGLGWASTPSVGKVVRPYLWRHLRLWPYCHFVQKVGF